MSVFSLAVIFETNDRRMIHSPKLLFFLKFSASDCLFRCPNLDQAELCEKQCDDDFWECFLECDITDTDCVVNCDNLYIDCERKCPCRIDGECENGCPCPNFSCDVTTEVSK